MEENTNLTEAIWFLYFNSFYHEDVHHSVVYIDLLNRW